MSEFGSIFDYAASTQVFCWMGMAFLTAYAVLVIWNARDEMADVVAQPA